MKDTMKPLIAFILGIIIVFLYPTDIIFVFVGMVLIAIGIIDLAWITIQPPKQRKSVSRHERVEKLRKIKHAVTKGR